MPDPQGPGPTRAIAISRRDIGDRPESPAPPLPEDDNARTSLMWAAKEGNAEAVHMLIARNADVNDRDNMGWAAVHFAVIEKNPVTVSMFHFLGADMGVKTYEGDGLLHMAVRADDAVMIQLLLAAGCDPEDADGLGTSGGSARVSGGSVPESRCKRSIEVPTLR